MHSTLCEMLIKKPKLKESLATNKTQNIAWRWHGLKGQRTTVELWRTKSVKLKVYANFHSQTVGLTWNLQTSPNSCSKNTKSFYFPLTVNKHGTTIGSSYSTRVLSDTFQDKKLRDLQGHWYPAQKVQLARIKQRRIST